MQEEAAPAAEAFAAVTLGYVGRGTADLGRLLPFYTDVLGLELHEVEPPGSASPDVAWLKLPPHARLRLSQRGDASLCAATPVYAPTLDPLALRRGHHLAFRVADIARAAAVLTRRGLPFETQLVPTDNPAGGSTQLFLFDPDGNGVELADFPAALPQFAQPEADARLAQAHAAVADARGAAAGAHFAAAGAEFGAGSVGVLSLDHRALECRSWEAATAFYTEVLGLRPLERPAFRWGGCWLFLPPFELHTQEADVAIQLREGPWSAAGRVEPNWEAEAEAHHLCLQVPCLDAAEAALAAANPPCASRRVAHDRLVCFDREGNCIVLARKEDSDVD
ncbi:Glyoxalase/Bleomycin resistance protein/Dihydroxybiphenyl dioxygenase [Pelagophyceae sp. CCMP2097]|nr:Glyoxalase/Bleomycin resistance protein/Dihydroxybiphenyl dioxygenase [Pelagophyceae sp. CCMP2097]